MNRVARLIETLELKPHPEGGYFRETYRSTESIHNSNLPDVFNGDRNVSTGIYYLLESDNFSAFHKINQDEMWHFYSGDPIVLTMISPQGELTTTHIGNEIHLDQVPQFVVPKKYWFSAKLAKNDAYALLGCTVAPGFDFKDFHLASRNNLTKKYPQHKEVIKALTRA